MRRPLLLIASVLPVVAGAQGRPCGLGPAGTTWRLVERTIRESTPAGTNALTRRWLERATVDSVGRVWRSTIVRTPLAPSGLRDSFVVTAARRTRAVDARLETPPCARLMPGSSFRARIAESRDTITWRVGRRIDTLGVATVDLLADREHSDTAATTAFRAEVDTGGQRRTDTLRAGGRLAGTESRRRIVRLDDGMLLLDVVERRATGRLQGEVSVAGSASRVDRMEARPIAPASVALIRPVVLDGDSAIVVLGRDGDGRTAWRRAGDTVEMRTRHADGWPHAQRIVHRRDGTIDLVEDVAPLLDPLVVRWTVRDGRLVADVGTVPLAVLPTDRRWGVATTGTLELLAPTFATLPADSAWHPFALLVPSRRAVERIDVELRIARVGDHYVVHMRPPGICALQATLLFTADWTPLIANVGGPFGETRYPAPGTARAAALEAAGRVVPQRALYPTVSLADQQAGRC